MMERRGHGRVMLELLAVAATVVIAVVAVLRLRQPETLPLATVPATPEVNPASPVFPDDSTPSDKRRKRRSGIGDIEP